MIIKSVAVLSDVEWKEAQALIATCQAYDQMYKEPYLSNMLNFDTTMPSFFLAYEGADLVGLLTVYADSPDVEVAIMVQPEHRRKGVAKALYERFEEETKFYNLDSVTFLSERVFVEKYPDLLTTWNVAISPYSEYLMIRHPQPMGKVAVPRNLSFDLASQADIETVARFKSVIFEKPFSEALTYAREAVGDEKSLLYIASLDGQVVAAVTVDISTKDDYIYGLAVVEDFQRRGIGRALMRFVLEERMKVRQVDVQLAVETTNTPAKKLYESLGFVIQSEIVYLEKK